MWNEDDEKKTDFEIPDIESLTQASDDARAKKGNINLVGAIGDILSNRQGFGNFYSGKMAPKSDAASRFAQAAAEGVADPMQEFKRKYEAVQASRQMQAEASDRDPNSKSSMALKALAPRWNIQVTPEMSAYDIKQMIDPKKMMETEAQSAVNFENQKVLEGIRHKNDMEKYRAEKGLQADLRTREKQEKLALDEKERTTPFGVARTADDAKKIKEAGEIKADMDSKIQELIDLRQKYGAEMFNQEAVDRAKQLSRDLLLQKKQLAGLGVLSKTDMELVDSIIPDDPLQWNWSQLIGQDPTMTKLKSFKDDTNREFGERLKARVEKPSENRQVVKQERNKRTGEVRVTFSDGTQQIIPSTAGR